MMMGGIAAVLGFLFGAAQWVYREAKADARREDAKTLAEHLGQIHDTIALTTVQRQEPIERFIEKAQFALQDPRELEEPNRSLVILALQHSIVALNFCEHENAFYSLIAEKIENQLRRNMAGLSYDTDPRLYSEATATIMKRYVANNDRIEAAMKSLDPFSAPGRESMIEIESALQLLLVQTNLLSEMILLEGGVPPRRRHVDSYDFA